MKINIVGLQYRNLPPNFVEGLVAESVRFLLDPYNPHDENAVRAISNGVHFGFVEKVKSKFVSDLVKAGSSIKIKIVSKDGFKVAVQITNDSATKHTPTMPENAAVPGVYEIKFVLSGGTMYYVGQSTNIQSRIRQHLRDLNGLAHHNSLLQSAWIEYPEGFFISIIHRVNGRKSALQQQIELFHAEIERIEFRGNNAVNRIAGDLVVTKEVAEILGRIVKECSDRVKIQRLALVSKKKEIGRQVLDAGILKRQSFPRIGVSITESNVLTWINKTRWGPLDYVPAVNRNSPQFNLLYSKLTDCQSKIEELDRIRIFIRDFVDRAVNGGRRKYEVCSIKELKLFLEFSRKLSATADSIDVA